jgi:hypothetical protein
VRERELERSARARFLGPGRMGPAPFVVLSQRPRRT